MCTCHGTSRYENDAMLLEKAHATCLDMAKQTDPKKFARYLAWREHELARLQVLGSKSFLDKFFEKTRVLLQRTTQSNNTEACSCVWPSSWASSVHGIAFHVCKQHAAEFGINFGPYWEDEISEIKRLGQQNSVS